MQAFRCFHTCLWLVIWSNPTVAGSLTQGEPAAVILTDRLHQCLQRRSPNTAA